MNQKPEKSEVHCVSLTSGQGRQSFQVTNVSWSRHLLKRGQYRMQFKKQNKKQSNCHTWMLFLFLLYIVQSHSRQKEVRLAFGVADKLEVEVLSAEWLLIFLFRNSQKASEAGKHRACICLQCEVLHIYTSRSDECSTTNGNLKSHCDQWIDVPCGSEGHVGENPHPTVQSNKKQRQWKQGNVPSCPWGFESFEFNVGFLFY